MPSCRSKNLRSNPLLLSSVKLFTAGKLRSCYISWGFGKNAEYIARAHLKVSSHPEMNQTVNGDSCEYRWMRAVEIRGSRLYDNLTDQ